MGLFDKIKTKVQEKVNEVHVCCVCGAEFSGLMKGRKLNDGQYTCPSCTPKMTDLMCTKPVRDNFNVYALDADGIRKYHEYCRVEKARADEFNPTANYLGGKFIVDKEHGYFKLKDYKEIFLISEIETIAEAHQYEKDAFNVRCVFSLDNWIYKAILVEFNFYPTAFLPKGKRNELAECIAEFVREVCPHAELISC